MFYLFLAFLAGCWMTRAYMLASFDIRLRLHDEAWQRLLEHERAQLFHHYND